MRALRTAPIETQRRPAPVSAALLIPTRRPREHFHSSSECFLLSSEKCHRCDYLRYDPQLIGREESSFCMCSLRDFKVAHFHKQACSATFQSPAVKEAKGQLTKKTMNVCDIFLKISNQVCFYLLVLWSY